MGPLMICKALLKSPVPRLEVQEGQGGPSGVNRCVEGVVNGIADSVFVKIG